MTSRFSRNAGYVVAGSAALSLVSAFDTAIDNIGSLYISEFFEVVLVLGLTSAVVVAGILLITPRLFSFAVAIGLTNFLWSYTLVPPISDMRVFGYFPSSIMAIIIVTGFLTIGASFIPRDFTARAVAAVGAALVTVSALQLAAALYESGLARHSSDVLARAAAGEALPPPLPEPTLPERNLPDIVYIVPDRYASNAVLSEFFSHDNSVFTNELKQRGFFVAHHARANYYKTRTSLASMFQMQYLDNFLRRMDQAKVIKEAVYELIRRNHTIRRLKDFGYRYVHVPSWWDGSNRAPLSDMMMNYWALPGGELGRVTLARSLFVRAYDKFLSVQSQCAKLKQQLRFLETAGDDGVPTFVFAHVLVPHTPILTDANGRCIKPIDYPSPDRSLDWADFKAAYVDYLTYLNGRLLDIFDRQRTRDESVLFVIQADEGPFPRVFREEPLDWRHARADVLRMKFGILNALYLGGRDAGALEPPLSSALSPVNNWRVLFSVLEGRSYPHLPNRNYVFVPGNPYKPIEVTERLSTPGPR